MSKTQTKGKSALGRGLDALLRADVPITTEERENLQKDDGASVETFRLIEIARVTPNRFQPRIDFDEKALHELKNSIQEKGVIQPITVRRYREGYELISGERRVRASIEAGLTNIPAYILNIDSDQEMMELALIENVQREDLNPIEVALGYQRLIQECQLTQEMVADRVGKDRSTVTNLLRILRLQQPIQDSLRNGEISMGHARALLTVQNEDEQLATWKRVVREGLSVRRTETLVKETEGKNGKKRPAIKQNGAAQNGNVSKALELTIAEISSQLRQVLGTQVKVRSTSEGEGTITIDFYTSEDLERLLELFAIIERENR